MLLFSNPRVDAALEIPPEFIYNSFVWEALERAQLSSFLQGSREGIDTVVGENGIQLLGLDEATSALDAETERIIAKTLDSLTGDITLIVIDQRLATVRHCDQVIHLVGGSLGEGPPSAGADVQPAGGVVGALGRSRSEISVQVAVNQLQ
jgi:ABC-type multidrug transport system fused ATPase/permease subunit